MARLSSVFKIARLPSHFSYGLLCILGALALGLSQSITLPWFSAESEDRTDTLASTPLAETKTPAAPLDPAEPSIVLPQRAVESLTLAPKQTLASVLSAAGVDAKNAHECVLALRKVFDPSALKAGLVLELDLERHAEGVTLHRLSFQGALGTSIDVRYAPQSGWKAYRHVFPLKKEMKLVRGVIRNSLYSDAQKQGLPASLVHKIIQILSHEVDFQRDLQPGDSFSIVYQREYDEKTGLEKPGHVVYTEVQLTSGPVKVYGLTSSDQGGVEFYNHKGESIRRGLLRTPVDGARLSSGFGLRSDPIHGFTRKHQGVDFAAPAGTPVMAAGDGVIEHAQYKGNYGNYILIRHNNQYKTVYAHLQKFHKSVRSGKRVNQGDVIGYVGRTGRATGFHLHHEIHQNGRPIDPKKVKTFGSGKLSGEKLRQFEKLKAMVHKKIEGQGA